MPDKNSAPPQPEVIYKELDPNDPEIVELNRIGKLVPFEVARQAREYEERMEMAERAFGKAVRSIVDA